MHSARSHNFSIGRRNARPIQEYIPILDPSDVVTTGSLLPPKSDKLREENVKKHLEKNPKEGAPRVHAKRAVKYGERVAIKNDVEHGSLDSRYVQRFFVVDKHDKTAILNNGLKVNYGKLKAIPYTADERKRVEHKTKDSDHSEVCMFCVEEYDTEDGIKCCNKCERSAHDHCLGEKELGLNGDIWTCPACYSLSTDGSLEGRSNV